ncbi:hypothetical protein [uncultured Rummeliibacillus sp.]|uniref:hypothetical protein n=1 Tax=uncultured Rummeliibacillus sp. TaxID=762292 RepID=UPI0026241950|nr:hypothetical protein [uncultured Rummeliibacillus sp.]
MAWGRENNRKIIRASTPYDVERKIKAHQKRGWRQISEIQTECKNSGLYAVLMQFENKKHA